MLQQRPRVKEETLQSRKETIWRYSMVRIISTVVAIPFRCCLPRHLIINFSMLTVYTAFTTRGQKSARWCHDHFLNFRALSRAFSIRSQLLKFLKRFNIPLESCGNDTVKIRKCLVSGYFANAAKMTPDGSFRTIRDNAVRISNLSFRVCQVYEH